MLNRKLALKGCLAAAVVLFPALSFSAVDEIVVSARKTDENLQDVPVAITALGSATIEEARIENLNDVAALTPGLNFFSPAGEQLPVPVIRGVAPTDIFGETNAAVFVDGVYVAGREGLNFALLDVERIEIVKGPQSALYGRNAFSGAINYVSKRPSNVFMADVLTTIGNDHRRQIKGNIGGPLIADFLHAKLTAGYDTWDGSYENPIGPTDVGGYTYKNAVLAVDFMPTDNLTVEFNGYMSDDTIAVSPITAIPANCEDVGPNDNIPNNKDVDFNERLANFCGDVWDLDQTRRYFNEGIIGNPNIPAEYQFVTGHEQIAVVPEATGEKRKVTRTSLKFDWDIGVGNITAITGYSRVTHAVLTDGTEGLGYTQPFVYCTNVLPFYFNPPDNTVPYCLDTFPTSPFGAPSRFVTSMLVESPGDLTTDMSQELRFRSPLDRPVRYSIGTNVYKTKSVASNAYLIGNAPMLPAGLDDPTGPGAPAPGAAFGPWLTGLTQAIGDPAWRSAFQPFDAEAAQTLILKDTTRSYALFATLDWDITDALTADFQLRYNSDDKAYNWNDLELNENIVFYESFKSLTGRIGLKYSFNDDWMTYISVSNAEKSGGFGVDTVDVQREPPFDSQYEPKLVNVFFTEETLLAYEWGVKGTTLDDRLRFDVSLFLQDWGDIVIPQIFTKDPETGRDFEQPESFNTNAGDATVKGIEIQGDLSITDNWSASFGASYTDAEMDNAQLESFADLPSFAPNGDVSGNKVSRTPKKMASATLRYERDLGDTNWTFSARGDASYQGKYYGGLDNQWTIPSRTVFNGSVGFKSDEWSVSFWAKNILNDNTPIAAYRNVYFGNTDDIFQERAAVSTPEKFFPWRISITHPRLRTIGVTIEKKFGGE